MTITDDLERMITVAQSILGRLDNNEQLSNVLSQVRLLMGMKGNRVMVAFTDILIHGLINLPYQGKPFTDQAYKDAGIIHAKICAIEDISRIDVDSVIDRVYCDEIPIKDHIITLSVYQMENLKPPLEPQVGDGTKVINLKLQNEAYYQRVKQVLVQLRAFIYDHVSKIWVEATREEDRIRLLGVDYRIVTDRLDALDTPVGGALLAAVDNLNSTNPDNWSLAALGCRNVILSLSTILWKGTSTTYVTQSGEELQVTKNKEKNRLLAYIDNWSRRSSPDEVAMLTEAQTLVVDIYTRGSKGKKAIRRHEAQDLVVDTFRLVDLLNQATNLQPSGEPD